MQGANQSNATTNEISKRSFARRKRFRGNGLVLFEGPSEIDDAPIVVVMTGVQRISANSKTGGMLQTWILRSDVSPSDARKSGDDHAICGDCPLRSGACYVTLHQGPRSVYAAYRAGRYASVEDVGLEWLSRHSIRFGSYGDPAAVPARIWFELAARARSHTGYTHRWRERDAQVLRWLLMASVDTPAEAFEARSLGWRTFRIRLPSEPRLPIESVCPASNEGGNRVTCQDCGQCDGARAFDLRFGYSVIAHGAGQNAYRQMRLRVLG